jgi:nitrate reductase molybdenum cofactor assembly chaperone NarJ/NarW
MDAAYEAEPVVFGPESDPDKEGARAKVAAMIQRLRHFRGPSATAR